jgi:hypothetical protein
MISTKNKQPQALPMAESGKKKQPRVSAPWLSFAYIACKLTMNRRTPRISITTTFQHGKSFTAKLSDVHHQSCASFLMDL